eukprot:m.89885 g.89885  ORF g.89885 m.89885 type:complete len:91 (+) comp8545_c1_seq1:756-1028(+)
MPVDPQAIQAALEVEAPAAPSWATIVVLFLLTTVLAALLSLGIVYWHLVRIGACSTDKCPMLWSVIQRLPVMLTQFYEHLLSGRWLGAWL